MSPRNLLVAAVVAAFVLPTAVSADDHAQQPILIVSHCMKSASADYMGVETEIWLPMHQENVNQGNLNSWALYWVEFGDRSKCDFYVVESYLGQDQFNAADQSGASVFETVHPGKDISKAMARTMNSRQMVESTFWWAVDGVEIGPHSRATVNYMQADDPKAYLEMESELFKPVHQALVDAGHRKGWGVYGLIAPTSDARPYNFVTVDFFDSWGPVPMGETFASVHPDKDSAKIGDTVNASRQMVENHTLLLIAATEPAATN